MPRIRTIKPEAPQHRKVGALSDRAFRMWLVGITQADDEGRFVCEPSQMRLLAFGYHPEVSVEDAEAAIQEVTRTGLVRLYAVNGTRYAVFPSWKDHQKINRPSPSKLPSPPPLLEVLPVHSMTDHGALTEDSLRTHPGSDQDQEGIKDQGSEGIGGECRGEPSGVLRSASPREAASLRTPGLGNELPEAGKDNGTEVPEDRVLAVMAYLRTGAEAWTIPGNRYSPQVVTEAKRRLAEEASP